MKCKVLRPFRMDGKVVKPKTGGKDGKSGADVFVEIDKTEVNHLASIGCIEKPKKKDDE